MNARGQRALARRNRHDAAEMKWFSGGLGKKKLWNQTQRKKRFSRREKPLLYVFVFQVQGIEVHLQQQQQQH